MKRLTSFALAMGLVCAFGATVYGGNIIYVPDDQPTIQAGIDAASDGDTVVVADGIYTGEGNKNIDFGGKAITLMSENGPENCIVDGENEGEARGFYFHGSETSFSVLDGFTIRNFSGGPNATGRGILMEWSHPTIKNCRITKNRGGIWCNGSSPVISNCIIDHNTGPLIGGGILIMGSNALITNCIIALNVAGKGGGICFYGGDPTITNCTITGNADTSGGGAMYVYANHVADPVVTNCIMWADSPAEIGGESEALADSFKKDVSV